MSTMRDGYRPWVGTAGALAIVVGLVVGSPHTVVAGTPAPGRGPVGMAVPASPASTVDGRVGVASALRFTNRTTADGLGNNRVWGVYVVGSTVYAATDGGLSMSTNGGMSFTNDDTTSGLGSNFVNGLYATDDTVYAATTGGLSISTDDSTFTNYTTANGLGSNFVWGVYATDDTVYAATALGLSISTDDSTFINRTTTSGLGDFRVYGVYAVDDTVYAATNGGLSISTDDSTFINRTTSNGLGANAVTFVYATDDTVYAATTGGLAISTDDSTFTNYTTADGLGDNRVYGVYAVGSTVYAATDGGLSVSTDGGASFTNYTTADGLGDNAVLGVFAVGGTVYVATYGGLSISGAPQPGPAPVFPPSAPRDVVGVPGDREVGLSWTAPESSGSFPVTHYQAVVSPGGQTCLVASPAVTCTISGLRNGTAYTATVRALNGAGWGPDAAASAAFTPQPPVVPSITITGTRADVRGKPGVVVTGTTAGFGMGAILRPWVRFPGQTSSTQGTASILVDVQGDFTWQRRTGKTIYVSIRSEDGTVESNRLVLRTT